MHAATADSVPSAFFNVHHLRRHCIHLDYDLVSELGKFARDDALHPCLHVRVGGFKGRRKVLLLLLLLLLVGGSVDHVLDLFHHDCDWVGTSGHVVCWVVCWCCCVW